MGKCIQVEIINNRYKIKGIYEEEINSIVYKVNDLWDNNRQVLLKLFGHEYQCDKIVSLFVDKYIDYAGINHSNLLANYSFDLVQTIDNKRVSKKQYFYTKEYIEDVKLLDIATNLQIDEIMEIINQLLIIANYLRFRGVTYRFMNPSNIYVNKEMGVTTVKLKDLASIAETEINRTFDDFSRFFMTTEVRIGEMEVSNEVDIYSIGKILHFLLSGDTNEYTEDSSISSTLTPIEAKKKVELFNLIERMTKKDPNSIFEDYENINKIISSISGIKNKVDFKEERGKLNFNTRLIGRDKELDKLQKINEEFENRIYNRKLLSIYGESGIGKTRLLQEMEFKLRIMGRSVYYTSITSNDNEELMPIIKILRQMIKNCGSELIDKYGCELVKVLPDLSYVNQIKPSPVLNGPQEKLRLYDRIINFIVDFIKNEPTYIIIDDLQNSDMETLNLINYFIKSNRSCPLLFILSFNKCKTDKGNNLDPFINIWSDIKDVEGIELLKFNLEETSKMIKNILGVSYESIRFSTRVINETLGNPRHIEEILKNLYASGDIFINSNGTWDLVTQSYSDLKLPSNIDDAIKNQISLLDEDLYEITKIISIFNTSVSKTIIRSMQGRESVSFEANMDKLLSMKILDERVEDWGYTYDFYNIQLKRHIYHSISEKERNRLHELAACFLEELYAKEKRGNKDELVYHFTLSHQLDKAIFTAIDLAKKMKGVVGYSQLFLI